jgi:hypothetical protein
MGKIARNIHRKDSENDHAHKLEKGGLTGGMLNKPNKDRQELHSHLYQHEGKTYETNLAPNEKGHTHDYQPEPGHEYAETAGPVPVKKGAGPVITKDL